MHRLIDTIGYNDLGGKALDILKELLGKYYDYAFYDFNEGSTTMNSIFVASEMDTIFKKIKQLHMKNEKIEFEQFDCKMRFLIYKEKENKEQFIKKAIRWIGEW